MSIYFTSDLHFNHDREFIFGPRHFENATTMSETIVKKWNDRAKDEDDIYVLGDLMLGKDPEIGMSYLRQLKGRIHIILGNHDIHSEVRLRLYRTLPNVVEICDAKYLKWEKYTIFLSHCPCITGSLENGDLRQMILNFYGHTHQKTNFYLDMPFCYHVGVDSHDCELVPIEQAVKECWDKINECISKL